MISIVGRKLKLFLLRSKLRGSFYRHGEIAAGSSGFIVEFIGPPGVGKTTYCDHLAMLLNKDYSVATGKQMKALLSTSFRPHINYKQFHIAFISDMLRQFSECSGQLSLTLTKIKSGLIEFEADALANSYKGIVINDEGLGHHFTEVFLDRSSSFIRSEVAGSYLENRLIVFLDCSPETVLCRVKERFQKLDHLWDGHKGLTDVEVNEITKKDLFIKRRFCNLIKEINKSTIIVIDTESPFSQNINLLMNTIKTACPSGLTK